MDLLTLFAGNFRRENVMFLSKFKCKAEQRFIIYNFDSANHTAAQTSGCFHSRVYYSIIIVLVASLPIGDFLFLYCVCVCSVEY